MVYETGETVWLDIDKSELPAKVGQHLEHQCPGRPVRLRDLYGVGRPGLVTPQTVSRKGNAAGARVLVVDDDADVRAALAEILEIHGYVVASAANGKEALALLREAAARPAVIVLDVLMPEMDGWQFRAEQKKDPALAAIPVVVVSAMRNADGFDAAAVFHKPVNVDRLLAALDQICSSPQ
jgi:CheY-like chemotaxis protein